MTSTLEDPTVYPQDEETSKPLYGAPTEQVSVLGNNVTFFSATMLNLGQMLGSGIYAVPGSIVQSVGSVGLLLCSWIIGSIFSYAGNAIFAELTAMFPNRSGAEVVWLEQAFPRPRFLVPIAFAVTTVLLSFSATNAIVFAQYALTALDIPVTPYSQTAVAIAAVLSVTLLAGTSTKLSLRVVNILGSFKLIALGFIIATGAWVLSGYSPIQDPWANYRNPWEGSSLGANSIATGFLKVNMCFTGYTNAYQVVQEVKGDRVRTISRAGYISITLCTIFYFFTNMAYVAVISREEMVASGQLVGALFFKRVYGESVASRALPVMVAVGCLGNLLAVWVGHARVIREVARQGLLPYSHLITTTRPFGTPLGPVLIKGSMTVLVILLIPAGDAYNFLIDVAAYPNIIFAVLLVIGLWSLRERGAGDLGVSKYRAPIAAISIFFVKGVALIVLPWIPPKDGQADVSFWYATYCVVGLSILFICYVYYYVRIVFLPKLGGYEIVEKVEEALDGSRNARLVRRYKGPSERQPLLR